MRRPTSRHAPLALFAITVLSLNAGEGDTCHSPLHSAAHAGDTIKIPQLLSEKRDVNERDKDGQAPLHKTALKGWPNSTQLLLAAGANPDAQDTLNNTPLHSLAEILLGAQSITTLLTLRDGVPCIAVHRNKLENMSRSRDQYQATVALLLLHGATLTLRNYCKRTPLDVAEETIAFEKWKRKNGDKKGFLGTCTGACGSPICKKK